MKRKTTLEISKETDALLEELKEAFGEKTNAGVIRKALQLSRYMARNADDDNAIIIETKDNQKTKLLLAG